MAGSLFCAWIWIDKEVNDTFGHPIGDALLRSVTERLVGCVREGDTVSRLSGDEFAIVHPGIAGDLGAEALAQRIINAIEEPYEIDGHQLSIGVSVGIAIAPENGCEPDELLKNADLALYRAKTDGRGALRFFEPEMDTRIRMRRQLQRDLRRAVIAGEFELLYQPIIQLDSEKITGFEALLRWNHPELGTIMPEDFIPVAEDTGLMPRLGEWVIRQACQRAATWPEDIRVAVNLSAVQFRSPDLVATVPNALSQAGLRPNRLEIEITESVLLRNTEGTLSTLHQLRELGVRISLDDFGTGYSSMSYLITFPFDNIKIDRSFIHDLPNRRDCIAVVRAVTSLAGSLNMTTTAEGVETEAELTQVRSGGCTEAQGFCFQSACERRGYHDSYSECAGVIGCLDATRISSCDRPTLRRSTNSIWIRAAQGHTFPRASFRAHSVRATERRLMLTPEQSQESHRQPRS